MTKLVFNLFQQSLVTLDCTELLENKKSIEGNFQLIKDWIRDEQKDSRYPPLLNREQAQWYNRTQKLRTQKFIQHKTQRLSTNTS